MESQTGDAAVRIAMTVGAAGNRAGRLLTVTRESKDKEDVDGRVVSFDRQDGKIFANLQIGADVAGAKALQANAGLAFRGMTFMGQGFILTEPEAKTKLEALPGQRSVIKPIFNGRDIAQTPRNNYALDTFGLSESQLRSEYPSVFQHLRDTVYPDRDAKRHNNSDAAKYADDWWLFAKNRPELRRAWSGLSKFMVSPMTAKHRYFVPINAQCVPDQGLIVFALQEVSLHAVLSSRVHVVWSLAAGGRLGVGNDPRYNNSRCFDPFPFPEPTDAQKNLLGTLGEALDAHRKRQQAAHPKLTLTNMYNVLEKLRAGDTIEGKDKEIYDQGLIGILRDLHDQIDDAVADAYGWPVDLSDEDILMRLVDLNKERAAEEAAGHIRWLRPDYQNPTGAKVEKGKTTDMDLGVVAKVEKAPWPKGLPDQIAAVREALLEMGEASPEQIARRFARARTTAVQPLLESLAALGQADKTEDGKYAA